MAAGRSEVLVSADARSSEAAMGSNATDEPGFDVEVVAQTFHDRWL